MTERFYTLEAVAACLRDEGVQAITDLEQSRIKVIRHKTIKMYGGTVTKGSLIPTYETTHIIYLGDDARLYIYKGRDMIDGSPQVVDLADPECFQKVKTVVRTT